MHGYTFKFKNNSEQKQEFDFLGCSVYFAGSKNAIPSCVDMELFFDEKQEKETEITVNHIYQMMIVAAYTGIIKVNGGSFEVYSAQPNGTKELVNADDRITLDPFTSIRVRLQPQEESIIEISDIKVVKRLHEPLRDRQKFEYCD